MGALRFCIFSFVFLLWESVGLHAHAEPAFVLLEPYNHCSYRGILYPAGTRLELSDCPAQSPIQQSFQQVLKASGHKHIGLHFYCSHSVEDFIAVLSGRDRIIVVNPDWQFPLQSEKPTASQAHFLALSHLLHHIIANHFVLGGELKSWKLHQMELDADLYSGILYARIPPNSIFDRPGEEMGSILNCLVEASGPNHRFPSLPTRKLKVLGGFLQEHGRELESGKSILVGKMKIRKLETRSRTVVQGKEKNRPDIALEWAPNGFEYTGSWKSDDRTGSGIFECRTCSSGQVHIYVGEFVNGRFHGEGTAYWGNGMVYAGKWEDGMRHGWGAYMENLDTLQAGNWVMDKFTSEQ